MLRSWAWRTVALATVLGISQPAWAESSMVYAKPGSSTAQVTSEIQTCMRPVMAIRRYDHIPPPPGDFSVAGVIGAEIATLIVGAVRTASERDRALIICMRKKGFAQIPLSTQEEAVYSTLAAGPKRDAWLDSFLISVSEKRVAEALQPAQPLLPASEPAPFLVGPLRLQPDSLKLAEGAVRSGGALVTARATRRAIAVVKVETDLGILPPTILRARGTVQAGAVFHQVSDPRPFGPAEEEVSTWCGPAQMPKKQRLVCVNSQFTGQGVILALGPDLLAKPDPEYVVARMELATPLSLELLPPETGPIFDVALKMDRIAKDTVYLSATATHEGKEVQVWSGERDFTNGRAVLEFWDRDLVITKVQKTVTVAFGPRTDGLGWYHNPPEPNPEKAKSAGSSVALKSD